MLKDYYQILQIQPHSTLAEIKQAFRRLAMIYHPDKNPNDKYAEVQFNEIKEAYEILTNPLKKERYLQERWYQSLGKKRTAETITPVSILKLSLELEQYVSKLDVHRMDKQGLYNYIDELLSGDTIKRLNGFNEPEINTQIISTILNAMKPLPLKFVKPLLLKLGSLAGRDEIVLQRINVFLQDHKRIFLWERYKGLIILIFTALICILIYLTSK
jgi:molecular chaperone DnaJ